jgi:hypothetical protein
LVALLKVTKDDAMTDKKPGKASKKNHLAEVLMTQKDSGQASQQQTHLLSSVDSPSDDLIR